MSLRTLLVAAIAIALPYSSPAISSDADTLLLLHFDNNTVGLAGEVPTTNTGLTYSTGVSGQAAFFQSPAQLYYSVAGNFDSTRGSLEFWIKPTWAGNDGETHVLLRLGSGGGVLVAKDGANNLRIILNRFAANGQPEVGVGYNVASSWTANTWQHVAFNWGDGSLQLYINGALSASTPVGALPIASATTLQLGADGTSDYASALLDELRISSRPRTAAEVASDYAEDIPGVTSISISQSSASIWATWGITPSVEAVTGLGTITVPPALVSWSNPSPGVVRVDAAGKLIGLAGGTAALSAQFRGRSAQFALTVRSPVLAPEELAITSELSAPSADALYDMPVVILTYLPTNDGVNIDTSESGGEDGLTTIAAAKAKIATMNQQVKFSLSEGSRFHGYKSPTARPSLGYRVVKNIVVYEPLPRGKSTGENAHFADFNQILERFGAEQWVMGENVKEIWLWGYHTAAIAPVESNMSSPTTGDISNSHRFSDDMPIYGRTYTLYNYNYGRSQNEAVHNHGHQLEAILAYANQLQDGNDALFWDSFCGRANDVFQQGRCGNTHFPPNGAADYDYNNVNPVSSDCEDWRPDNSGAKKQVSAQTWESLTYAWPVVPDWLTEAQYYIYWMQNMPGHQNGIRYGNEVMRNWWEFTANWDVAIRKSAGLHKSPEVAVVALGINPLNKRFQVRMTGDAGYQYLLQASSDLVTWSSAATGNNFSGELLFEDLISVGAPRRFYKAQLSP